MNAVTPAQLTKILLAILIAAGGLQLFAWSRMRQAADDATQHAQDLAEVRSDLEDLNAWHVASPSMDQLAPNANDTEFTRHIRTAAEVAEIPDQIASIEPGQPARVHDSDFTETPVYVRLASVNLRQLITFLHELSSNNRSLRSKMIELSAPDAPSQSKGKTNPTEMWTADVTLNNLAFSPKPHDGR